jgi:hypothetical protein
VSSLSAGAERKHPLELTSLERQTNAHRDSARRTGHLLRATWEQVATEFDPDNQDSWSVMRLTRACLESAVFDAWLAEDMRQVDSLLQLVTLRSEQPGSSFEPVAANLRRLVAIPVDVDDAHSRYRETVRRLVARAVATSVPDHESKPDHHPLELFYRQHGLDQQQLDDLCRDGTRYAIAKAQPLVEAAAATRAAHWAAVREQVGRATNQSAP